MSNDKTIDERVAEDDLHMIVQNIGRQRSEDGKYADLWSCTLAFPDDDSDQFWINTGQTARTMSGVIWGGAVADQGQDAHPDIESVVQMLCKDAVDVENSDGRFDVWLSDFLELASTVDKAELERRSAAYRRMQQHTEQLRDFLGWKFDAYLHMTEWTR
ncbi:hypothetical protein [Streptomyces luteogriseus]|uniref:hypothetical protein n=1 Tax=Streptomyces luteogriseus TaxID=68233 RepID=UPI0037B68BA3